MTERAGQSMTYLIEVRGEEGQIRYVKWLCAGCLALDGLEWSDIAYSSDDMPECAEPCEKCEPNEEG